MLIEDSGLDCDSPIHEKVGRHVPVGLVNPAESEVSEKVGDVSFSTLYVKTPAK
jgi:hypothetical protein